jgi:hypothetical protein
MVDTDGAPNITVGGKDWPVPILAAKQNKIIDPLILSLIPLFAEWQTNKAAALAKLGSKEYDALQEISFQAIRRAHPEFTREQFLDLPVTLPELISAFPIVARQTGVFERTAPGEAPGAQNPQTGTPSSPTSAT